jgi:hypothetical protein
VLSAQEPYPSGRGFCFSGRPLLRTAVYIDGFNLYYAIKQRGFKWLNLKALADSVLPVGLTVSKVKYYTARVSGAVDANMPHRQQLYLAALKSIPEVEIYYGNFLAKAQWRPLVNLPIADRDLSHGALTARFPECSGKVGIDAANPKSQIESVPISRYGNPYRVRRPASDAVKVQVFALEEKGSDVNLAVHLVHDAWSNLFDAAAVITNDTDLVEPIRIVTRELKKPVYLLCAAPSASSPLVNVATHVRHIHDADFRASQFPNPVITLTGRKIPKPPSW